LQFGQSVAQLTRIVPDDTKTLEEERTLSKSGRNSGRR